MHTKRPRVRAAFLFFFIVSCKPNAGAAKEPEVKKSPPPIPASVSASRQTPTVVVAHNVLPAVVNIQVEATMRRRELDPFFGFFGGGDRVYKTQSVGSGFVWNADGTIVTNNHVIEGASRVTVNFHDGTQLPAKVIGVDPDSDVAVLSVDAKRLPAAPIGTSSDLMIGEQVIAVGNPFGLSGTVTTGVVSALGRSVPVKDQDRTFTDFIQTDASINPGNSGGPLLNIEGKVIGINVAIYAQAQGIGFAIPVDRARKVVEDLRQFGKVQRAWIGAVTATLTPEEAHRIGIRVPRGAMVIRVFSGSPAERAGLRPGDVIVQADGVPVDSRESLNTITATALQGHRVRLQLTRDDKEVSLTLTPVAPPADMGLEILSEVTGVTASDSSRGVAISQVDSRSRGAEVGLEPGDLIVGINGMEVRTIRELNEELIRNADRSSIVMSVARGRFIYTLTFPMGVRGRTTL